MRRTTGPALAALLLAGPVLAGTIDVRPDLALQGTAPYAATGFGTCPASSKP